MSLKSKVIAHTQGNLAFWCMLSAIVLMGALYLYSVNRTVMLVAERNDIEGQISTLKAEITGLESTYISEKSEITMELASSLGYGEASRVIFVPQKSVSVAVRTQTIQ